MAKKKSPALRLLVAMIIGLFVIEVMIELSTGTTMWGGRNGLFVSRPYADAKIVNTPMQGSMRIIRATDIYETPTLQARKVGILKVGTRLRIVGKTTVDKNIWYQVDRFGGKIGYISADAVVIK